MPGYWLTRYCKKLHTRRPNVCIHPRVLAPEKMMLTNCRLGLASTRQRYRDQMEGSAQGAVPR